MVKDGNALSSVVAKAIGASNNDDERRELVERYQVLAPWINSDDYKALPRQLKLGVVHLLSETLRMADSPHTSHHLMEDTLALSSYGAQYLTSHTREKCTLQRLETHKRCRDMDRQRLDAKAANLVLTWRCQRFPTHGMPPLELKTSEYLIPEVQKLQKNGGSTMQAATKVNEDALRAEIKRYSKTLKRRCVNKNSYEIYNANENN
ncbi:LOW QUALITY PROTEIN: Pre-mRNA-processing factor 39 [Phytophthora palmivora]|uniref:Pre-mRNA-processing factor 39 n=1 Tax=Phytophthora palmivora TaxID=4796 RepID=A0A2P4YIZ5_9STRA|nr:LOW QUALITY PROTEIN: Pre-mRNA-processing factor 39 [Phytophthora palmivora]